MLTYYMVDLKQVERFPSILISRNYLLFLVTIISDEGKSHLIQCRPMSMLKEWLYIWLK